MEGNPLSCGATRPDNLLLIMEAITRWFKYDRDKLRLVYTQIVPVIFEPPCTCKKIRAVLQILQLTPDVPICTNLNNFNISRQFLWITQLPVWVGIAQAV